MKKVRLLNIFHAIPVHGDYRCKLKKGNRSVIKVVRGFCLLYFRSSEAVILCVKNRLKCLSLFTENIPIQ